jgi:class 3 adenylate cyclase
LAYGCNGCDNGAGTMSQVLDNIEAARSAAGRLAWRASYDAFSNAEPSELTPEDYETYGDAAWWTGKLEEAIRLRERAYAGYSAAGDKLAAARMALTMAWDQEGRGAYAVSQGWFGTAKRLLEGEPESVEHGRVTLTEALGALMAEGDLQKALGLFEDAFAIGQRVGDRDLQILSLSGQARTLVTSGEVERGLALHDEASAAAVCGELKPFTTGLVYCLTISSCQDVGDFRRAAEWTEAANRWCDEADVSGFPGTCRLHRAEIMRLRGDLSAAEKQAVAACEELRDFDRNITAGGYYEIGEVRRRLGDFAGAEAAFANANEWGRNPQPGLALLRFSEGKIDVALAGLRTMLEEVDAPIYRIRVLPALVEVAVAAGDLKNARAAADELEEIVDSYKIGERRAPAFDATVHAARGRILLAEKDWDGAVRCLRKARDEWQAVGAPFETAQARALLGTALRRRGDEQGATVELEGALAAFERLGARIDAARVQELLGRLGTRRTFLFTDIVDSTKLLDTLGDEKWRKLLARHDDLVRERIQESGGEIVKKTGDGFFASFENPKAALDAAVAIQRALGDEIVAPDVRIGAHTGEAFRTGADSSDYGGQGVHLAARIGGAAGAGEILVSTETLDGVGTAFRLSEPRPETLKGFAEPVEVVSVLWR